jgi:hypothetical protein
MFLGRSTRLAIAAALLLVPASTAFVACVGDSTEDGGQDATTTDSGTDSCVTISSQPGVDCFSGGRCALATQQCCVGITGSGLVGACSDSGACGTVPFLETWSCDKGFDCPVGAPKCCAGMQAADTLFMSITSGGGCPLPLHVDIPDAAGDALPPPFTIATCQTSCTGPQLCATNAECGGDGGLHCVPAQFSQSSFSKTFGVCLP